MPPRQTQKQTAPPDVSGMPPRQTQKQLAPDGGWGWLIILGSSLINLFTRSIEPSFGLLFGDVLKHLGVSTTGAAFIMSARDATINFSGFLMGPLLKNFSYRKVGVMGAILSSVGLMTTASANSMTHILLTYSLVGGLGFGVSSSATFIALSSFFVKRRGQAFGLAMAGTALGFMLMPQIISRLLEEFGFYGTMLLMGALCLNALAGAALLQPVKWHLKIVAVEEESLVQEQTQPSITIVVDKEPEGKNSLLPGLPKNHSFSNSLSLQPQKSESFLSVRCKNSSFASLSHLDLTDSILDIPMEGLKKDPLQKSYHCINNIKAKGEEAENNIRNGIRKEKEKQSEGCWQKLVSVMDFDLLLDPIFLNTLFGLAMAYLAEINFKLMIPFFMDNLGYTRRDTAQALSLMAIADICARLLIPPIFDRLPFTRRSTLTFGLVFVMIARSVLAEQTTWRNLIIVMLIHGFFRGFALINLPLVVAEAVTKDKLASAFGLFMVSKGVFVIILGPLVGWIRDYTGSYSICLHAQSAMIMVCVVSWTVEYFFRSRSKQRHKPSKEPS